MGRSCDTPILYLSYTNYNTRTACSSMDKKNLQLQERSRTVQIYNGQALRDY